MAETAINMDALNSGLKSIKTLRSTVMELVKTLSDGAPASFSEEEKEKYVNEAISQLANVKVRMRELETACTLLGSPAAPLSLGNSGVVNYDPAYEKTPLYAELIKSNRWFDKLFELSSHATSIFGQHALKRAQFSPVSASAKRIRIRATGHNLPSQTVDLTTAQLIRFFPELNIQVHKQYGSSTIMLAAVARQLKVLIMMRGLIIDWVVVKGYHEDFFIESDKNSSMISDHQSSFPQKRAQRIDIWSSSRYLVFQKITDHANAAMLHFYSPNLPELAVRSFLTWLRSYATLFSAPCRKCGSRLFNNMPPTWRDLRNLDPYHEACKN